MKRSQRVLCDKVPYEQKAEQNEEESHTVLRKGVLGSRIRSCKGPAARARSHMDELEGTMQRGIPV